MSTNMPAFQQRVLQETRELKEKIEKLSAFIQAPAFTAVETDEQDRLRRQLQVMNSYGEILGERIAAFSGDGVAGDREIE